MKIATDEVVAKLRSDGYYVERVQQPVGDGQRFVLDMARSLGELYVPKDCDPSEPVICTAPTRSRRAAPFDRSEAIGWHGDFATYEDRPQISLVYITRADPRGGNYGAWRLASVNRVLERLQSSGEGRSAFNLLRSERLPFSYAEGEPPRWFHVIQPQPDGNLGIRFYLPSIQRGCVAEYGNVPIHLSAAVNQLERAAEDVGEVVPTEAGSLLVASNWSALHDRVQQTISRTRPNREALLCFVAKASLLETSKPLL
jgi:hypothetical protein